MEPLKIDYRQFPVLVVDDEENNLEVFRLQFRRRFDIQVANSAEVALGLIRPGEWEPAVVVSDQRMPGGTGIELLRRLNERLPDTVGIILTAYSDWDVLLEALNSGIVYRYLSKPWQKAEMEIVLQQAIERYALEKENRRLVKRLSQLNEYLEAELKGGEHAVRVIGEQGGLARVMSMARQLAASPSTVMLRGESGTGKEVIARTIHECSARASGPFVKVSCAALSPSLLESELFGHEKGAFTGAVAQRIGRFELAHKGTLFLDEVGDLPPDTQVKLLRVLQEREFERVGGSKTIKIDVRVISATHQDLEVLLKEGRFREDLYYRLNVVPIYLPPLRDRPEDIPELVRFFVDRSNARSARRVHEVSEAAMARLVAYRWPGNVRELQNVVERAVILNRDDLLDVDDLSYGWEGPTGSTTQAGRKELELSQGPGTGDFRAAGSEAGAAAAAVNGAGHRTVDTGSSLPAPTGASGPPAGTPAAQATAHSSAPSTAPPTAQASPQATAHSSAQATAQPSVQLPGPPAGPLDDMLDDLERQRIVAALERARGRKAVAARELGLSRTTLYYRLRKHQLLDDTD